MSNRACFTIIHAGVCVLLLAALTNGAFARPSVTLQGNTATVSTSRYLARITGGSLVYFKDRATGETLLQEKWLAPCVRFVENGAAATARVGSAESLVARRIGTNAVSFSGVIQWKTSAVIVTIEAKAGENELIISGRSRATGKFEGLASMTFPLGATLPHTQVIVPTMGGNAYSSSGLKTARTFEWPITWEAAMLQVHGKRGGLLVCAFEPFKRYKNLEMTPGASGWNIALESENHAPFEGKRTVQSLQWHVRPYAGEWRNGARAYRDWHARTFRPDPAEEPNWVHDIRAEMHCGTDLATLDALVKAGVDPRQTLLYIAGWRVHPYDVNYPDYTPADHLAPFMEKAHKLGFRVMLHANYFGCDPKMPDYAIFGPFQIKHKYSGALQWWEWPKGANPTKFAYINSASREWRRFFVARMVELIGRTGADSIHLDQTLCIYNDKNGLIDGLSVAQGNLLLHEELKAALPRVAFSGEGLDEVTMIHEAFAQRHVAGIDHTSGTFSRASLKESHPVCAYLFGGRTKPYEYLGSGNPDNDQFTLAWRDAYRHWGVIRGYGWPNAKSLENPSPCARQTLNEIIAFQKYRLDPWTEGPWPADVDCPYRSASGEPFAYVSGSDGWSLCRTDARLRPVEELVRVVTGAKSVRLPGTIPGALCYDRDTISGLDPNRYYVYSPETRDMKAFHLECGEGEARLGSGWVSGKVAFVRAADSVTLIDTPAMLGRSETYYLAPSGKRQSLTAALTESTGALVQLRGPGLFMHPQWKGDGSGIGAAEAVFNVDIPNVRRATFMADCRIEQEAVGKSDGVVFRAVAECEGKQVRAEVRAASSTSTGLSLPIEGFAGKRVAIRVAAFAGPKHDPTHDWGMLESPRVTVSSGDLRCNVVWPGSGRMVAPAYRELKGGEAQPFAIPAGGVLMVTSLDPTDVAGRVKLSTLPQTNVVLSSGAGAGVEEATVALSALSCGGVERQAFFSHPPDHGMRMLHYFIRPPAGSRVSLRTAIGLRDGSTSEGVRFAVWLNGNELWSKRLLPSDGWQPVEGAVGRTSGDPVMLTLVTDSDGPYFCDWALWADPEIVVD